MATKKITFDPEAGAAYAANFAMLGGANFEGNFEVEEHQILLLILRDILVHLR